MKKIYLLAFALIGAISNVFTAQAEDVELTLSETAEYLTGGGYERSICGNISATQGHHLPTSEAILSAFATRSTSLVWGIAQGTSGYGTDFTKINANSFSFTGRFRMQGEFVAQTYVLENNAESVSVSFNISGDGTATTSFSIWSVVGETATKLTSSESAMSAGDKEFSANNLTLNAGSRLVLIWAANSAGQVATISNFSASYTKAEPKSYNLSIGSTGWATIYLDFNATIPSGVKVYGVTANAEGTKAQLAEVEVGGVIAANKGYLVNGAATSYTFNQSNEAASAVETDMLGSVTDTYVEGAAYVLADGTSGVGFYKTELNKNETGGTGESHFKNNANKAYLPAPAGAESRFLVFNFGDDNATAIENIQGAENATNALVYDLAGRRVQSAKSGLYIINGKKVIK